jgi:hypothetical protein
MVRSSIVGSIDRFWNPSVPWWVLGVETQVEDGARTMGRTFFEVWGLCVFGESKGLSNQWAWTAVAKAKAQAWHSGSIRP